MSATDRPPNAVKIPRAEFDDLARAKRFRFGPWLSAFGDGMGEPYVPARLRSVWGELDDGRAVWADHE
jgi:hypothetical protein